MIPEEFKTGICGPIIYGPDKDEDSDDWDWYYNDSGEEEED